MATKGQGRAASGTAAPGAASTVTRAFTTARETAWTASNHEKWEVTVVSDVMSLTWPGFAQRASASLRLSQSPGRPSRQRAGPGKASTAPKVPRAPGQRPNWAPSRSPSASPTGVHLGSLPVPFGLPTSVHLASRPVPSASRPSVHLGLPPGPPRNPGQRSFGLPTGPLGFPTQRPFGAPSRSPSEPRPAFIWPPDRSPRLPDPASIWGSLPVPLGTPASVPFGVPASVPFGFRPASRWKTSRQNGSSGFADSDHGGFS
jgi:hypothetical protein